MKSALLVSLEQTFTILPFGSSPPLLSVTNDILTVWVMNIGMLLHSPACDETDEIVQNIIGQDVQVRPICGAL